MDGKNVPFGPLYNESFITNKKIVKMPIDRL